MSEHTIDQQFIEYIVKSLVGHPEDVVVDRLIDEKGVLLTLTVNPEDLGRVIGKRGATAQSMRTLLRALGTKQEARFNLKITDNGTPRPERSSDDSREETDSPAEQPSEEQKVEPEAQKTDSDLSSDDGWNSKEESTEQTEAPVAEEKSRLDHTRRELEDLDDLDI